MRINFFWTGLEFQYLYRLTIASHINVGHEVRVWKFGKKPTTPYWINDIKDVEVCNAGPILKEHFNGAPILIGDVKDPNIWNPRTLSSLFCFLLLRETGEWIADTDAIALKHWHDEPMVLPTYNDKKKVMAVGALRIPANHPVLDYCIKNIQNQWGNVHVFTEACKKHNLKPTVPNRQYYPFSPKDNSKDNILLRKVPIKPNWYSIHFYGFPSHELKVTEEIALHPDNKGSILNQLHNRVFNDNLPITNPKVKICK